MVAGCVPLMRMRRTMRGISNSSVISSADCRTTIFSRGIVIVEIAQGRHDVQAVCMILAPAIAAALRSTMALPATDHGDLWTMYRQVLVSQLPEKRGARVACNSHSDV